MTQLSISGTLTITNPPNIDCPTCNGSDPEIEFSINEEMELIMVAEQPVIDQYNFNISQGSLILTTQ